MKNKYQLGDYVSYWGDIWEIELIDTKSQCAWVVPRANNKNVAQWAELKSINKKINLQQLYFQM